jgi:hypothetical protein
MTLIVLTVVVIALLIATLAIFLYAVGVFLNRTAGNLGECVHSVEQIVSEAANIGPGVKRINGTGGAFVDTLPVLCEAAEQIGVAKSAPYVEPFSVVSLVPPEAVHSMVPAASVPGLGYLDEKSGNLGYLDV